MPDLQPRHLRRILRLRRFKLFEAAEIDELATIAENLVETTLPAGTVVATAGTRVRGVHLILDGCIETVPRLHGWGPRQAFGALEVFAGRPVAHTAVAATPLETLYLSAQDIGEVLEDNFGVLLATLRELAMRVALLAPSAAGTSPLLATRRPLGLVERLILLRQQQPFSAARLQALSTLALASDEVIWPAHSVVVHAGEPATNAFVLIDGRVRATRDGGVALLEPGAPIGHLEMLGGLPHSMSIETMMPARVLRSSAAATFDVLEDHTDVGLAMLATFAAALLDAPTRPPASSSTTLPALAA